LSSDIEKNKKGPLLFFMLVGILLGCAVIVMKMYGIDKACLFTDPGFLYTKICKPLLRLCLFISLGLFVGQYVEAMGWADRIGAMARPFMRWGHLTPQMGASFTSAFFSGTVSLSMIMAFYQEGTMDKRQLKLSVLMNTFPSYFLHLPTTFFILLPLVGKAGAIYMLITFSAALLRLIILLTYSRLVLPPYNTEYETGEKHKRRPLQQVIKAVGNKFVARIKKVLLIVIPVYTVIAISSEMGFFLWLRKWTAHFFTGFVPVEAMSVVIFSIVAEFTSGYAAAGAMLDSGALTLFQAVVSLLAGNIIATPIRSLRHQLPYYMGIFDHVTGLRLMVLTQLFRVGSLLVAGSAYVLCMIAIGC